MVEEIGVFSSFYFSSRSKELHKWFFFGRQLPLQPVHRSNPARSGRLSNSRLGLLPSSFSCSSWQISARPVHRSNPTVHQSTTGALPDFYSSVLIGILDFLLGGQSSFSSWSNDQCSRPAENFQTESFFLLSETTTL